MVKNLAFWWEHFYIVIISANQGQINVYQQLSKIAKFLGFSYASVKTLLVVLKEKISSDSSSTYSK
jgi:hypothetical protein